MEMSMIKLLMILMMVTGCQAKQTVNEMDEIDKELAAESELYETDELERDEPEYVEDTADEPAIEPDEVDEEFADLVEAEPEPAPAPVQEITGRFETLAKDCVVRDKPRGKRMHVLRKGKRLWVEEPDPGIGWYQVYTRTSLAYVSEFCFR